MDPSLSFSKMIEKLFCDLVRASISIAMAQNLG